MKLLKLATAASLLLGVAAPAQVPQPRPKPTKAQLKQCPDLARIDWKQLTADEVFQAGSGNLAPAHAKIRGPNDAFDLSRGQTILKVVVGGSHTQQNWTSTSSYVWQDMEGRWQVSRVDYADRMQPVPPPPPIPGQSPSRPRTAEEEEAMRRTVIAGPLDPIQAARIEAGLADPCLAIQPDAPPMALPLGKNEFDGCYGGTGGVLEIVTGGTRRIISDPCARFAAGPLMQTVMYARIDPTIRAGQEITELLGDRLISLRNLRPSQDTEWRSRGLICGEMEGRSEAGSATGFERFMYTPVKTLQGEPQLVRERHRASALQQELFARGWAHHCGA